MSRAQHQGSLTMLTLAVVLAIAAVVLAAASEAGEQIFLANCALCHQAGGQGLPGMYPPLANSAGNFARVSGGRAYLVHVVSFGMAGTISAHGQDYTGAMQPWPQLSDAQVADVLNYLLTQMNSELLPKPFAPFTSAEVKKLRAAPMTPADVRNEREAL